MASNPEQQQTQQSQPQGDLASDPRVHFDQQKQKWCFEDDDGNEMEWDANRNSWVPVVEDDLVNKQQAAYSVEGVDENTPAAPVLAREAKKRKKERKDDQDEDGDVTGPKKQRKNRNGADNNSAPHQRPTRAVFVSSLPQSTTVEQLREVFSKAGLIMEDGDGEPKIKLYKDDQGRFKGEALVVYLQEASVELALKLLDETELVLGSGEGVMKVRKAEWSKSDAQATAGESGASGSGLAQTSASKGGKSGGMDEAARQKQKKRAEKLKQKLTDWSSSDDEATAQMKARARLNPRAVVLKGMFTLKELEEDPALLLDLKEDVREECEGLGQVTNVTLYDKEPDGIITVRFKEGLAAKACIAKMHGRFFGGRAIAAHYLDNASKYKKSGQGVDLAGTGFGDADDDRAENEREAERLKKYAEWLEKGGDEQEGNAQQT